MSNTKNCFVVSAFFFLLFVAFAIFLLLLSVIGSGAGAVVNGYDETHVSGSGESKVLLVDVKGTIANDATGGLFSAAGADASSIVDQINEAMKDPMVEGILIEMDTPGGEIVASDLIYQKLLEAREAGLRVVTYMHTFGASGGYYIAAASDTILANELTTTGSIGVYSVFQDVSGLYEKVGIEQRVIKHGDFKTGEGLFDEEPNGEEDKMYQDMVDDAYDKFVSVVAAGRGMTTEEVDGLADGKLYMGVAAVENGLIDGLGGYNEAVEEMYDLTNLSEFQIIRYTTSDFFGRLFGAISDVNINAELLNLAEKEQGIKMMYLYQ